MSEIIKVNLSTNCIEMVCTKRRVWEITRSYAKWEGLYQIVSCQHPITSEEIAEMKAQGLFSYGQFVNAHLRNDGTEIYFEGACDGGD